MALSASIVWECRASGAGVSDSNGGGWAPLTVSTFSGSDLVVDGANPLKVTSASHNFVAADVNARIQITNAVPTSWTSGFYTIASVSANAAILNASPAAVGVTAGVWVMVGQDRSQQNSPQVVIDNSAITTSIAANVITFTGYTPTVADVGNVVKMTAGTNVTVGWYVITAFTGSTWTVAGTAALPTSGTTTNATGNMGGALLTLSNATGLAGAMVLSNRAFVTGAFTQTATLAFNQSTNPTGSLPATMVIGYGATRGDGIHATVTLSTNTGLIGISLVGNGVLVQNIDVNCASLGTSTGISIGGARCWVVACKVSNFTTKGVVASSGTWSLVDSEVTGGTAAATAAVDAQLASSGGIVSRCFIHDNVCPAVRLSNSNVCSSNLIVNNTGAGSDGIVAQEDDLIVNNTIHGNGRDGIRPLNSTPDNVEWRNNLITNNGGWGINNSNVAFGAHADFDGNAYFSNTSGPRQGIDSVAGIHGVNPYVNTRDVILSVSPYVGGTTGTTANFALNNTAGGGAACRAAGSPGTFPGNTGTTGYLDMGAVQTRGSNTSPLAGSSAVVMAV